MIKIAVLCCFLSGSFGAVAANYIPSFVNGSVQSFAVCQNSLAKSVNSQLAVLDTDFGQTEIWDTISGPLHGTLSGFSYSAPSNHSIVTPAGLTYTPASGYTGNDTFVVMVSDGADTDTTMVVVTVNALPTLSSALIAPDICDGSVFSYTPSSSSSGATFSWSRSFTGGIDNPSASGTGDPSETLISNTYYAVPVTYMYTITAGGCINHQNVVVAVKPTPRLLSDLYDTICSGGTFAYTPVTATTGTTFTWSREAVSGLVPATPASGAGSISETFANTTLSRLNAVYSFALNLDGCSSTRNVTLSVDPQPTVTTIATGPSSVCSGAKGQNFSAGSLPPSGITYSWSAANASIAAVGNTKQNCIVDFPSAGTAVLTLTFTVEGSGCVSSSSFTVNVGSGIASSSPVLYYNSQFVYLDNNVDKFQWGYDDAATLDSNLVQGATFQSYPITNPDFVHRYYWIMTSKAGCLQKTYYNAPLALVNIHAGNTSSLVVYPNPAENTMMVEMTGSNGVENEMIITDVMGQTMNRQVVTGNTARFDVSGLPAGCYVVCCLQNGVKTAFTRFVKY